VLSDKFTMLNGDDRCCVGGFGIGLGMNVIIGVHVCFDLNSLHYCIAIMASVLSTPS
jgi:hypothetical protein